MIVPFIILKYLKLDLILGTVNINMASNNDISSVVPLCATLRLLSCVWVSLS